jgi:GTP pyrophosphokinase
LTRKVYVYDENGSVFELPVGSTPIDFAYHIYPNLENQLIEAYVNGKKVLPGYILKSNDLVEIKIKDVIVDPIDTYAPYIKTMVAKNKIIKY